MTEDQPFVDYYHILQVSPNCDAKILETAYRHLAKTYHPDHPETADVDKFNAVVQAYRVLRNPQDRQKFDLRYREYVMVEELDTSPGTPLFADDSEALTDAEAHEKILLTLYKKRRENAQNPGVMAYYIQEYLKCSDAIFEFHIWYLKSKGYIVRTEQGTLAITVEGVDHVISMSRSSAAAQLLITRSEEA